MFVIISSIYLKIKNSEIYSILKRNKKRFTLGAFWSVLSSIVSRGSNVLAFILIARLLGKEGVGQIGVLINTVATFSVLAGAGLGMGVTKSVAEYRIHDRLKLSRIITLYLCLGMGTGLIASGIMFISSDSIAQRILNEPSLSIPIKYCAIIVFLSMINNIKTSILSGLEHFKLIAKVNLVVGIASLIFICGGSYYKEVLGAIAGLLIVNIIQLFLLIIILKIEFKNYGLKLMPKGIMKEKNVIFSFAVPSTIASLMVTPALWICNVFLINQTNGYEEMGVFSAVQQWYNAIIFLPSSLGPLLLTVLTNIKTSNNAKKDYWASVKLSFIVNLFIVGLLVILIILFSEKIMNFYGEQFVKDKIVLVIFSFTALIVTITNNLGYIIASSASMWSGVIINLLWAISILFFSNIFIEANGVIGLAYAYLISYTLHFIWSFGFIYMAHKFDKLDIGKLK